MSVEVVAEGLLRSVQFAFNKYEGTPPFERRDAISPGFLDLRVFDQCEWWVDVLRRPHASASMSADNLENVVAFSLTNTSAGYAAYLRRFPTNISAVGG